MIELSDRERQVLDALAEGLQDAEIAAELHLSKGRVMDCIAGLRTMLRARNRTHLVALAYHHGLLVPKRTAS